ncbi:MAG TPA: DNA adenine methylase [Candidatus Lokiarchaeia archaeon]
MLNFTRSQIKEANFIDIKKPLNKRAKIIVDVLKPFLKMARDKNQLISQMDEYFPKEFNKYIEPFVSVGAISFYLLPKKSILIDINLYSLI